MTENVNNAMIECNECSIDRPIQEIPKDETIELCEYHQAKVEHGFKKIGDAMKRFSDAAKDLKRGPYQ
jgi:predicted rRNA methylase YqxC with S4 and FtsJ domains